MTEIARLLTLCPDLASARQITAALLDQRLIACANIGAQVESHYIWQGAQQQQAEIQLWVKTSTACAGQAMAAITRLHPYEVPMIAEDRITVNADYAAWVCEMVSKA